MMHNNNTRTMIAVGCQWCETCLYDGWGECSADESRRLGQAVVDTFHGLCQRLGREDIYWCPATSDVQALAECDPNNPSHCYANADGGRPHVDLDGLHEACCELVMELSGVLLETDGGTDLSDRLDPAAYVLDEQGD